MGHRSKLIQVLNTCKHGAAAVVASSAMLCVPSQAAPLSFFFDAANGPDLSFTLDLNPSPDVVTSDSFGLTNVDVSVGGNITNFDRINFFTVGTEQGGFNLLDNNASVFEFIGPQLFSGTTSAPTFLTGQFSLVRGSDASSDGRLTITAAAVAVPEPQTFGMAAMALVAMLMVGFKRESKNRA